MKNRSRFQLILIILLSSITSCNKVTTYPAPVDEPLSKDFTLEVDGKPVDIYLAKIAEVEDAPEWTLKPEEVGGPYSFAYFDISGSVTVKITSVKKELDKMVIRPLTSGVEPVIEGNTITFTIDKPCQLSIEPDGRIEPLLIFANPVEKNAPKEGDPNVIYFGPGVHKPTKIELTSGQTLYIAGGAIVKGGVSVSGTNVKIKGRGILCGNDWPWRKGPGSMVRMNNAKNVTVDDIILRGSWGWTMPIYNSDSVTITNVKLCCSRNPNDDGINPCNSQNIVIRNCFIRSDDDCVAMKGIKFGTSNDNVENITIENCIMWCDRARVFLLGHESRAPYMRNITIRNLDIIHFNMCPFLFEPGEEMSIENVLIENVTAYADYPAQWGEQTFDLIRLKPTVNQYMRNKVPGKISNIRFKNVALTGEERDGKYPIWIIGTDSVHMVHNISFENVTWFGHELDGNSLQVRIEDNTADVQFLTSANK
jgi:hypothetical protein